MAEETVLSDEFVRQLMNVGEVDLIVAVPTANDAKTIGGVVRAVRLGLLKCFPRERAVLVNADCGSRDGSAELARQASIALPADAVAQALRTFHTVTASCVNGAGTKSPVRLLLATADLLRAKACAVVSPSEDVTPSRVERLLAPIYRQDFDLVAPLYKPHKFDGLLVRLLLYPLFRATFGRRIREPYGREFGFSGRLGAELFAREDIWQAEVVEVAETLRLTMSAVQFGYRVCEVFLGPRGYVEKPTELVSAMRQTVGTMFHFLDADPAQWQAIQGSEPIPREGPEPEVGDEPLRMNPHRIHGMFHSGVSDLQPVLASILTPETAAQLSACAALPRNLFRFPDALWVRTVYEFAAAYHRSVISRDHIIQALVPIYRGKLYEFLILNRQANAGEVVARNEALCLEFERHKPYLLQIWENRGGAP